jgi:hypothetical protein
VARGADNNAGHRQARVTIIANHQAQRTCCVIIELRCKYLFLGIASS